MNSNPYKPGRRVFWHDPDGGLCSSAGKITTGIDDCVYQDAIDSANGDGSIDDLAVMILTDSGSEVGCMASELVLSCTSTGFHDGLTYGFGEPDGHGYFDNPDYVGAREAEKRDKKPLGCYWPFTDSQVPEHILALCPLCKSPAVLHSFPVGDDRVECEMCGCNVPGITAIVAITKWNTRS